MYKQPRGEKILACLVSIFFLLFYVYFQSQSVYGGDAGDLVTAAYVRGVPHPPGYPVYTFLGWLLTKLPLYTVAWRVSLLSSIPAALTLGLLYYFIHRLTRKISAGLIAASTLGFSYLFWLYAIVPETFMLNVFFAVLLLNLVYKYHETRDLKYIYGVSLTLGLSLTHHHTILFITPALYLLLKVKSDRLWLNIKTPTICFLLFIIGLLPYLYVFWAASKNPAVNWEAVSSLADFYRLVTRAVYGTFLSHRVNFIDLPGRLVQVALMAETILIDFTKLGVAVMLIGAIYLYLANRRIFWVVLLAVFITGPFFFFYAGFPSAINFHLGTMERFLLLPYIFISIWLGLGLSGLTRVAQKTVRRLALRDFSVLFTGMFMVLPLTLLWANLPKLAPLKYDRTAENLGSDILATVPDDSIILLLDDTILFNTQYVYFTGGGAPANRNVKLVQLGVLEASYYAKVLHSTYPETFTDIKPRSIITLIGQYYSKYPIYSSMPLDTGGEYGWAPYGFMYRAYEKSESISVDDYVKTNKTLTVDYHDPLAGALSSYTHVMLADILRVYANSYNSVGETLLQLGQYGEAEDYFHKSTLLLPEVNDFQLKYGYSLIKQEKCEAAEKILTGVEAKNPNFIETYRLKVILYRDCFRNEIKTQEYEALLKDAEKKTGTSLKQF